MDAKVVVESHMDTGLSIAESKIDVEPETIEFKAMQILSKQFKLAT